MFTDCEKGDIEANRKEISRDKHVAVDQNKYSKAYKKNISLLVFAEPDLIQFAKVKYKSASIFLPIDDYDSLFKELINYSSVLDLVLFIHGVGGSIMGTDVRSIIKYAQEEKYQLPIVKRQIIIHSCNMGLFPATLLEFALLFKAPKAIAWTQFSGFNFLKAELSKKSGTSKRQLVLKILKTYQTYFIPGTPSPPQLMNRNKIEVLLEWWQRDTIERKPPINLTNIEDVNEFNARRWDLDTWKFLCPPFSNCSVSQLGGNNLEELRKNALETEQYYKRSTTYDKCEQIIINFP
ncbi:MAG: hypothetical protein ACFFC1_02145 [Promethearchaeota archaeon]